MSEKLISESVHIDEDTPEYQRNKGYYLTSYY